MSTIHSNRVISNLYPNLDVITESTITKSVDGFLKLKTGVSFGTQGRMFRHAAVKLSATDLLSITKALKAHEASLLELIGMFEETLAWCVNRYQHAQQHGEPTKAEIFNLVLAEESPLMLHAVHKGRTVELGIYGENLTNVSIPLDTRSHGRYVLFVNRVTEIVDTLRGHLHDIETLDYVKVMEGITK